MYTGLCHVVVAGLLKVEEGGRTLSVHQAKPAAVQPSGR